MLDSDCFDLEIGFEKYDAEIIGEKLFPLSGSFKAPFIQAELEPKK